MYKWNAEIVKHDSGEYGHFLFHDLSDSELLVLAEMASRSGEDVDIRFKAEKDSPDDVAVISGGDEDV